MTNAERKVMELRGMILEILTPYMKSERETNIGCGVAREIQRQMVELLQQAEQNGYKRGHKNGIQGLPLQQDIPSD